MTNNNTIHKYLLLILLSYLYRRAQCTVKTVTFYGDLNLNDKICVDSEKITQEVARSKIHCTQLCDDSSTCTSVLFNTITKTCTLCSGNNDLVDQQGTIFYYKQINLDGKVFKIYVKEVNKYWHYDGNSGFDVVSCIYQPVDDFTKFIFERQDDGTYKIKSFASPSYMYDGLNSTSASIKYLSGNGVLDDDYMRYIVTMETPDYYRIQTKATGRYVRLDDDLYISTADNIKDDRSLFELTKANSNAGLVSIG